MITVEKIIKELTKINNDVFVFTPTTPDDIIIKRYKSYKHICYKSQNRKNDVVGLYTDGSCSMELFMILLDCFDIKYANL